jgi:CRISPR/Cas system-associated endonuclease Cas3-HD
MSALSVQTEKHKPLLNLAILFHDLGKAKCYTFCKEKGHRYSGHAHESVELIENVCNRLKFSNDDKNALIFAAKEHMNLHTAHKMKRSSIFKHFNSEHLELLIDTVKCDDSCRLSAFNEKEMIDNVTLVRSTLNSVDSVSKERKKIIDGKIVMSITGEPQGKIVGDIIKRVTNDILDSEEYVCTVRRIKDTHNQMK